MFDLSNIGSGDYCVDFVRLYESVVLVRWSCKFVVVSKCVYYKFGCFVYAFSCDLMGGIDVVVF